MEETYSLRSLPDDMKRIFFDESKRQIFGPQLKEHALEVCRNKISERYIKNAIKNYTHGYLYMNGKEIEGFILWKVHLEIVNIKTDNIDIEPYIHIYLICSKNKENKLGLIILADIERFCIKYDIYSIIIQPADSYLEKIYNSIGYKKDKIPLVPYIFNNQMTKLVSESRFSKTRKHRRSRNKFTRNRRRDALLDYHNSLPLEMVYNNELL